MPSACADLPLPKDHSVFFTPAMMERARTNAEVNPWAAEAVRQIVARAEPWLQFDDDALWEMIFGATISRSWMVWSNGHCPACEKPVPMYNWKVDAFAHPWKVQCPHCGAFFPTNDFAAFYRSGLDEHGVFDPKRGDRALLFNAEHPDPSDPLHGFGVDDGEGYVDGQKRWRFIGTYLVYGQWMQLIHAGIVNCAAAYAVSGERAYAHKAGVLLDRLADLHPTYSFKDQGWVYEQPGAGGYISTWHNSCPEIRAMAIAYDQIFEALREDTELVAFLRERAAKHSLDNPKATFADIQRNIEERIFRDVLANDWKIRTNYPDQQITLMAIRTVLDWPESREAVYSMFDQVIERATAVDGLSGEKGLAGYSCIAPRSMAGLLGQYMRLDDGFLRDMLQRHPRLRDAYRFHIDTHCLDGLFYPQTGDTGAFTVRHPVYGALTLSRAPTLDPSSFTFLWELYGVTGDPAFVQTLYRGNGSSVEDLPYDLFAEDPAGFQRAVAEVIEREGPTIKLRSVNKQQWGLAILRSGVGANARAVWLDYDTGGGHGHNDGMNLGLFARGLDLLPELGYPAVQYGGWSGPRFNWYVIPASHNTVVIDGKRQEGPAGPRQDQPATTLWADGDMFHAIRASRPDIPPAEQFERTVALVDISPDSFYVLDIFRVVGGMDHAKFTHSGFGTITTSGLNLQPAEEYGHGTLMRDFMTDPSPAPGWSVDWAIEDRHRYLPEGTFVGMRYTDLTTDAQASTCEGWVAVWTTDPQGTWFPRVMVRRQSATAPLHSTFVSVLEPHGDRSAIAGIRRLAPVTDDGRALPDSFVALEVKVADGRSDILIAADPESPLAPQPAPAAISLHENGGIRLDGQMALVRLAPDGAVKSVALCHAQGLEVGELALRLEAEAAFVELARGPDGWVTVAGEGTVLPGS